MWRIISLIIFLFTLYSCKENNLVHGNWEKCNSDGSYWNYTLSDSLLVLAVKKPNPFIEIYNVAYINEGIILSHSKQTEIQLITNPDTLKILSFTSDALKLQSSQTGDQFELSKADFKLDPIDFNNYKFWKKESLSKLNTYAAGVNCAKEEENIPILRLDEFEVE